MKYTKKRKGISRSRSDSGVSCDSTRSSANQDKNIDLVSQAHEGNMANVAEQLENEREDKKLPDPCGSVNGKLSPNNDPKHTSSKLAKQQELFLSNLNMKLKPKSKLKKMKPAGKSTRSSLSDTLSKETAQIKIHNTDLVTRGKCDVQNKEVWNKYMLGKPAKSKTSKSSKRIRHTENCNLERDTSKLNEELSDALNDFSNTREQIKDTSSEYDKKHQTNSKSAITPDIHSLTTSETSKKQSKNISCTKQNKIVHVNTQFTTEISSNTSCNEATEEISDQTTNRMDIRSPKARKSRIPKKNKTLFNDNSTEQVILNSDISSPKAKKPQVKNINIADSTSINMNDTEDQIINSPGISSPKKSLTKCPKIKNNDIEEVINPKAKKTKVKKINQTTEITSTNSENSKEVTNQIINNSGITCPRSKGRKKSNKSGNKTLDSSTNNDQSMKKLNVQAACKEVQEEILPEEISLTPNADSTLSTEVVEDYTNADNSEKKCRKQHGTRSIESNKKSPCRKRKISNISENSGTVQEINKKNKSPKKSRKSQNFNNSTEGSKIDSSHSQEIIDTSINYDDNSFEIQSPKSKKIKASVLNSSETTKLTKDLVCFTSKEDLLVSKIKKSNKESNVNTDLLNTGSENTDVIETEIESHQPDIIEKLRNKYSVSLNCNLNPCVRLEKILPFTKSQWINKKSPSKNDNVIEEVQSQVSIKPDPEDSLAASNSSAYVLVTDAIDVESIKTEELSPIQLRNVRVILSDFKREKQRREIINLNRNWNLSKDAHHSRSPFKYKFTNDLVSINSSNEVFCGAHLAEGFNIMSPVLSPLTSEKSPVNETFDKTDLFSFEKINTNLSVSENDSTTDDSTLEVKQLDAIQTLVKSTNKLDSSNKKFRRANSHEKVNVISSEKLKKVKTVSENYNKILDNKVGTTSAMNLNELEKSKKSEISVKKLHKSSTKITRNKFDEKTKSEYVDKSNAVTAENKQSEKLEDRFKNVESNDKHNKIGERGLVQSTSKEKVVGIGSETLERKKTFEQCLTENNKKFEKKSSQKIPPPINDKINFSKNEIRIKTPENLNNELNKIEKNQIDENIRGVPIENSVSIDSFTKSKKIEREKTRIHGNKINEELKTSNDANHDLKAKDVKHDSHGKNKKFDKKHKHIKSELSHKTEIELLSKNMNDTIKESKVQSESEYVNKEKNIWKSTETSNETVPEQLPTAKNVMCANENIENKKIDTKYNKKDHFNETTKTAVKITHEQNEENTMGMPLNPKKQLSIVNNTRTTCSNFFPKPKHVFKFPEQSDIKRPPSRMHRKIVLNRPTMDPFKVPMSPIKQTTKSEAISSPSSTKFEKDSSQRVISELPFGVSPKIYERECDSLSIYADTIGVDSVADAASVRNDSDSDCDFTDDLTNVLPETEVAKHTNVNEWVENTFKICEIQKHTQHTVDLLDKENELSASKEVVPIKMSLKHDLEEKSQKEIISNTSFKSIDVKVEETKTNHVQHIKEVSGDPKTSCNISNKYQGVDIFKYMCNGVKSAGECQRKMSCHFKHELPPEWKIELKNLTIESILALYDHVKDKRFVFLFKKIFPSITEYLGDKRDFNNLIKMVKDVLEINMNSDRAPFINDIINALCKTGVTFHSIVEVVYKNANVNKNLINLLSDILLNLTVDKGDSNGNWPIIKELMQNRNYDIDNGIIQFIIIESLEKEKEFIVRVYHDLIKNISNEKLTSIIASLLNNFYNRLEKYNYISEANEFLARCQSLNIALGSKSDHTNSPSSSATGSPTVKNISKVPPFQSTPLKRDPKFETPPPTVSIPANINYVTPINRPLIYSGVKITVPPPPAPPNNPMPPVFNFPPPSFPPKLCTKPPPLNFKQVPVVNQKVWYPQQVRRRPVCTVDNSEPSTSGGTYVNRDEVRRAVFKEDISAILTFISKFKDNHFTDLFIKTFIEALLERKHTFPVFFGNLCHAAKLLNNLDNTSAYVIKTIGLNIILHLTQASNWEEAYTVYKIVRSHFSDDLFNVKLYLPEKYSYFKRILIISLIHIKQCQFDFAWSILQDSAFQYNSLWQGENNESEISFRNSIIDELLTSVTMKRLWPIGLNIVQYLIKNNVTGVDVKKYINDIFLHAINSKCNINDIMEFVNCSSNWYNYISKHIFRAIVAHTVHLGCWTPAKQFYVIGRNFEIYPQLIGNERYLIFSVNYIFEEINLMLEIFFENMTQFRPIKHNIMIRVVEERDMIATSELPIILQQYQITTTTVQVRITNILNNFIKPPITITKQNNAIVISAEIVNRHLEGRVNSNKPRLDS